MSATSSSSFNPSPPALAPSPSRATDHSSSHPLSLPSEQEPIPAGRRRLSRRRPNPADDDDDDDEDDNAPPLLTRRGQATEMPERSARHQRNVDRVTAVARENDPALVAAWNDMVQDYWTMAKAIYAEGEHQCLNRDVRDVAAAAVRTIPAPTLEVILMTVYGDMPEKLRNGKTLAGSFEIARQAATASVRAVPGANRDVEVSKWKMFLWFGREITTTVRQVKNISATLQATKRTAKVSFDDLTNRLWRKVFEEKGEADEYPSPTNAHLQAVVRELQAEKAAADEAETRAKQERELRRRQQQQEQEDRRNRRLHPQQQQQQGTKRARGGEEDEDEDFGGDGWGAGPSKRRRHTREDEGEEEEVGGGFGGGSEEVGRGGDRALDALAELDGRESVQEIENWLAGTTRWVRHLDGPADPDGILPDDVQEQFAAIRMAVRAATTRLKQVRDGLL